MKPFNKQSGLTLIELIIVVVVIALLIATLVPAYFNVIKQSANLNAESMYGVAKVAALMNFAKRKLKIPGHVDVVGGSTLLKTIQDPADGWRAEDNSIVKQFKRWNYQITVTQPETAEGPAKLTKDWTL